MDQRGQALVEYLLMTMLLFFSFLSLYSLLQRALGHVFTTVGRTILFAYY